MTRSIHRKRGIAWQLRTGRPLEAGDITLTPVARRLLLRWPSGGFVWQYPVAVFVEQEGEEARVPIPDPTRMAWYALIAATLFVLLILAWLNAQKEASA
ncbi:MAG: hypothetical protein DCC57_08820 [Chloroflexi bacterium]|nr:MAG: hypothetical protein DCC57_08820 [Chloroflexota bacterium]